MNVQQINTAIIAGNFTNEDLNSMAEAVKYARSRLVRKVKQGLTAGDNVNFTNSRTGRNVTGHVTKVAIKYVTVRTVDGLWKVPANMLTKIADEREFA
jgi:hypothetical protein